MKIKPDMAGMPWIPCDTDYSPEQVGKIIYYTYKKGPPMWLFFFGSHSQITRWYQRRLKKAKELFG